MRRTLLAVAAVLLLAGCASNHGSTVAADTPSATPSTTTPAPMPTTTPPAPSPTPTPKPTPTAPGLLPQTHALPNDTDPMFRAGVADLWQAIVRDEPSLGYPFFFPETAYLQVKSIADPAADYQNRLIGFYRLDIEAAHALLGSHAAQAQLVGVSVPTSQAEWILPGVEENKLSYYRVYGTRLTYRIGTHTASFGIFSLISWRGEWYCVHLGPNPRPSIRGYVYQPEG